MVIRILLSRFGCKNKPFYRVMAADSRSLRDGKHLEVLALSSLAFFPKYWLSVGAQPSDPVQRLLFQARLLTLPPMVPMGHKGGPCDTHPVDALTGRIMGQEKPVKDDSNKDDGEDETTTQ